MWVALALVACAVNSLAAEPAGRLRVLARYVIGGQDAGYDYLRLDPMEKRLYVAHASRVEILDSETGKVLGQIRDPPGVHGIALAPAFNHGFTSNGTDRSVTMFDLRTDFLLRPLVLIGRTTLLIRFSPCSSRTRQAVEICRCMMR